MDRAHHRSEVVRTAGSDLDRAHRARPHRPAVLEPAIGRRAGAVLVRDHPQRRARVRSADLVAALLHPLELRHLAELAAAGPAVTATGLGSLLSLLFDGLGALARTTSTPRTAAVGGVVLAAAPSGSKSCYPFTENPPAHRAPPTVRAGAGAPAVAGPSGPATLSLLTSSRAARPAPGPATTAATAATWTTAATRSRTSLRREGRSAPSPRAPTSGEPHQRRARQGVWGKWWWSGRGLTHDGAPEGCQTARTAASATEQHMHRSSTVGALAPARAPRQGRARAAEGETPWLPRAEACRLPGVRGQTIRPVEARRGRSKDVSQPRRDVPNVARRGTNPDPAPNRSGAVPSPISVGTRHGPSSAMPARSRRKGAPWTLWRAWTAFRS